MTQSLVIKGREIGKGKPLVCVPVMDRDSAGVVQTVQRLAVLHADMIEWRVDFFDNVRDFNAVRKVLEEIAPLVKDTILVFTFRSKNQGGQLALSEETIYDLHQVAAESGIVDLIDVEFFESKKPEKEIRILQEMGAHVISSHHDFEQTPTLDILHMLLNQMKESGTDIVKLAVMPQSTNDVLALLSATAYFHEKNPNHPLITMSMGSLGCISRVAGETFGSCVTFGALEKVSAPGQLPMQQLDKILDVLHESMEG